MSDEKQKYRNIKAALGDGKTRTIYIGGLAIVITVAAFAIWSFSAQKTAPRGGVPASEVPKLPGMQNAATAEVASKVATPVYDKLIQEQNQREAEKAKQEGGSAVPVMRAGGEQEPVPQPQPAPQAAPLPQYQPDTWHEDEQKRQQVIAARTQAMKNQVNLLITAWAPKEHTNLVVVKDAPRGDVQSTQGSSAAATVATAAVTRPPAKKAGDTCYAVLNTAVNTDEPSPVTATILQCGELDQAKIVGKIEVAQNAQKAVLRFTNINVPGQPTSLPMDGVAIDEATRRTALASDVDNHYFLRYGSLFASAFLGGVGEALLKGGQDEQIVTSQTGAVVQRNAYDSKQLVLAGIGNVGKQAGSNMGSVFNRPPTIKIDAGIGIGILFMSDLTLK